MTKTYERSLSKIRRLALALAITLAMAMALGMAMAMELEMTLAMAMEMAMTMALTMALALAMALAMAMTKTCEHSVVEIPKETYDDYHTFNELYEHRNMLYIFLVTALEDLSYCVRDHYEGWDLLVIELENGTEKFGQISYHLPIRLRYLYPNVTEKQESDHVFDGHTSDDVLERLKKVILHD